MVGTRGLLDIDTGAAARPGLSVPDPLAARRILRLGLAGGGAILLHLALALAFSAPLSSAPGDVVALIGCGLAGLGLLLAAGLRRPPPALRWLILLACLADLGLRTLVATQNLPLTNLRTDNALYTELAAEALWRGENPYTWDLSGAFDVYRTSQVASTPLLNAANEAHYPYPALSFLLVAPFQRLNLPGTLVVSLIAHAAVLLLLFIAAPPAYQPLILLPVMAGIDLVTLTCIGSLDIVWAACLVGMVVAWRRPLARAVLFGLALSLKQTPWLIAPFLLIHLWREERDSPRPWLYFASRSAATFLLLNAPFIAWNPQAWFLGVSEPWRDSMIFFSQGGLASLTQLGLLPLPKSYYLLAFALVLGWLLYWYWRHYDSLRHALWLLPGILMAFSYRNLLAYWVYWLLPALAALVTQPPDATAEREKVAWQPTALVTAAVLVVLLVSGLWLAAAPPPLEVEPLWPLPAQQGRVVEMDVRVVNASDRPLTPRFALQGPYSGGNTLPWTIERGPLLLPAGQSALYTIRTTRHERSFFVYDTAQLVVTDAAGDYALRGLATLPGDPSFLWPDAIPNPAYRFWDPAQNTPVLWTVADEPAGAGRVDPAGDGIVRLTLQATADESRQVALQSEVHLPRAPLGLWVYSDSPASQAGEVVYGLEVDDGQRRLRFAFAAQPQRQEPQEDLYVVQRVVPLRRWVYQEIDVPAAYAAAGWDEPPLEPAVYRGLDVDLRLVRLRLLLAAGAAEGVVQAYFGPLVQPVELLSPEERMAETLDDPACYYLRLAACYERQRNDGRALEAYQRALMFAPDEREALEGVRRLTPGAERP